MIAAKTANQNKIQEVKKDEWIGNDYTDKPRDINSHIPREQE